MGNKMDTDDRQKEASQAKVDPQAKSGLQAENSSAKGMEPKESVMAPARVSAGPAAKKLLSAGDFVELEYSGMTKEEGYVFDTTDEAEAKANGTFNANYDYGPIVICVGEGQVLKGLDKQLVGKETGKQYNIEIPAEDGFGKKSAKLIQLVPTSKFLKEKIQPVPGLQVTIDGSSGMIKTVTGGRTLVDFNHPLSSKDLIYKIKTGRPVTDTKEKVDSFLRLTFGRKNFLTVLDGTKLEVKTRIEFPKEISDQMSEKIRSLIPEISGITYSKM